MAIRRVFVDEDAPQSVVELLRDEDVWTFAVHTATGSAHLVGWRDVLARRLRAVLDVLAPPRAEPKLPTDGLRCSVCGALRRVNGCCSNEGCADAALDLRRETGRKILHELKRLGVGVKAQHLLEDVIERVAKGER